MTSELMFHYLINYPLSMLLPVTAFFLPLKKKENWYLFLPVFLLLAGACIGLGMLIYPFWMRFFSFGIYFLFHYILIFSCFALTLHLMCDISLPESYYAVCLAFLVQHLSVCLARFILYILSPGPWWTDNLGKIILLLLCPVFYFLFTKPLCREGHTPVSGFRSGGLLLLEIQVLYALSLLCYRLDIMWLHSLYAAPFIVILMTHEWMHHQQVRLRLEIQRKENLWEMHRSQYEMTRDTIDIINRKCHDMRHQMMAMKDIANSSQKQEAIDSIRQAVRIYDTAYRTGCDSLDTVLMQKALECSQDQISLSVIADGKLLRFMDPVDLYIMTANILDNAIESNRKIPDPGRRAIHLSVHEKKGLTIMQAENPYEGTILIKDGLPETTKSDPVQHGIGIRSIKATAEKYDGTIRIDTVGGMFVLRIIFPSREQKDADQDRKMMS